MKGNKQWSNPKNCTMQGPRPRWFITGIHDPPTSPFLKLHAGTVILALWFFGCTAQLSPLYLSYFWFVAAWWFRCPQSGFQWRGSDIVLSRTKGSHPETHTWEFDTTQGTCINAQVRLFSFQINWSWAVWKPLCWHCAAFP